MRGTPRRGVIALTIITLAMLWFALRSALWQGAPLHDARYVGSERCRSCHPGEFERWRGSHHALAMQPALDGTVAGDFGDVTYELRGKTWRFFRDGNRFVVSAEGRDGALHDYEVVDVFGVEPLQQYLVALPGGRLQALSLAWDVRQRRWFFLYPGRDIPPTDWLHWSRQGQNWNSMCADCHSTNVEKGYDDIHDTFQTTYSEVSVGCEACHGPGSRHVEAPLAAGVASSLRVPASGPQQVERCAACHARRAQFADHGPPDAPLLDRYIPTVLEAGAFYADGQILGEDFEYQSFVESKMYARGVACGDCHDVHSGKLRGSGNALCTRCHRANAFDTPSHHGHGANAGAQCVSCHMPGQTYMVVHFRRDHSLRVPQPDVASAIGAPNACAAAGCHAMQSPAWIASAYEAKFGGRPRAKQPHWGTVIAAGRAASPDDVAALAGDASRPRIARATALALHGMQGGESATAACSRALTDPDPLLRHAATTAIPATEPAQLVEWLAPRLQDPVRAVRMAAVARLAEVGAHLRTAIPQATFDRALHEYVIAMRYTSDQPSGSLNLGNLYAALGRTDEAERQYRRAIAIDDHFVQARVNLALLLAGSHRSDEAAALFRSISSSESGFAMASFDLGLLLAEQGQRDAAELALQRALDADPTLAIAAYNLAILVADRNPSEAVALLRRAIELRPDEPRYAQSLGLALERTGDVAAARAAYCQAAKLPAMSDAARAELTSRWRCQ